MEEQQKGYDQVKKNVENVTNKMAFYTIFNIPEIQSVELQVIKTLEHDTPGDMRSTPSPERLKEVFDDCLASMDFSECYYIVYDFGFYRSPGEYRNMVCLISYIPEGSCAIKKKFVYSSTAVKLADSLRIQKHVSFNSKDDFTYDAMIKACASHKKN
ncbi:Cofilin [Astathelohania contejeani]|uniref:Cofilin n=1 Tax=Astathelohania contejeani TaxID=164912 RepID=A0ABQ7I1P9_9MICR|nr:Cofilin [Thelohania contejeani]